MKIVRTNSENQDFINLVEKLDSYLKITDGDEHDFYNQFNNIDVINHVVLFYSNKKPVGCGAIKKFASDVALADDNKSIEVKRMFVLPEYRGIGIAQKVLVELEDWARELNFKSCILETGKRQVEAVKFYHKCNYKVIPNYGQYAEMENSICFEKEL